MRRKLNRPRAILTALLAFILAAAAVVGAPAAAAQVTIPPQGKVVVLGDSFASGRGSTEPYGYGSERNKCDRSPDAYGPLVANALSLQLTFVACAGATIDNVIHGMNGERGQFDSLNSETTLAMITVGGNDVGQATLALRCVAPFGSCDGDSAEYKRTMSLIKDTLPARAQNAFRILARQAPNAEILVIGYPQLVVPPGNACTLFTDSEKTSVRNAIKALNAALNTAVQEVNNSTGGGRLTFVDPNTGGSPWLYHELCTRDSYVNGFSVSMNGLRVSVNEDSFHPNKFGQEAYAKLIISQLQTA